jgi:PAS domain-containing protein
MVFNLSGQMQQMNRLGCELFGYENDEIEKRLIYSSQCLRLTEVITNKN